LSKDALAKEVVAVMNDNGINWRSPKDIKSKIEELQKGFNKIENWKSQTGAGILNEQDGETKIRSELSR
jgi:hypothetical protein